MIRTEQPDSHKPGSAASTPRLSFDRGTLLLEGIDEGMLQVAGESCWQLDRRALAWRCDALQYPFVTERLNKMGIEFENRIARPESVQWSQNRLPALRPQQEQACQNWIQSGCRGVVIMPTGTGKTEVALAAMQRLGSSALIVAPVRDLMYQWHQRILRTLGYDAGVLGDHCYNVRPITVTTYDSAAIHMPQIGSRFDLLIFDEVHHLPGGRYRDAAIMSTAARRLGLTATLERSDGRHIDLDWLVGPCAYECLLSEVRGELLADYETIRIPVALSSEEQERYSAASRTVRNYISARRKNHPSYDWVDLLADSGKDPEARKVKKAYYFKKSIEDRAQEKLRVLEDLFRLHHAERIIVFTGSNVMAIEISKRFLIPTLLNHSRKAERLETLEGFAEGRFKAIVANQVLDEGVDVPEAKVAIVIGGMASTRQAKQRLGRILRRTGKARAVLYEVVCEATREEARSRKRRDSDAYAGTRHRRI